MPAIPCFFNQAIHLLCLPSMYPSLCLVLWRRQRKGNWHLASSSSSCSWKDNIHKPETINIGAIKLWSWLWTSQAAPPPQKKPEEIVTISVASLGVRVFLQLPGPSPVILELEKQGTARLPRWMRQPSSPFKDNIWSSRLGSGNKSD